MKIISLSEEMNYNGEIIQDYSFLKEMEIGDEFRIYLNGESHYSDYQILDSWDLSFKEFFEGEIMEGEILINKDWKFFCSCG